METVEIRSSTDYDDILFTIGNGQNRRMSLTTHAGESSDFSDDIDLYLGMQELEELRDTLNVAINELRHL